MGRLSGKVALITGAARGQGAAAARRFVDEGARVMLTDVTDDEGRNVAAALGDAAGYEHLDVTDEGQWSAVVARTVSAFGSLDVLVNNAGLLHFAELAHTELADYERVVRVNQTGTFLGMRSVVEPMTAAGGGSIVNVSSVEGLAGMPLVSAYTASKFAIRGMTKVAALELGDKGIRVNSVHPGMIDTDMVRTALGGDVDASPAVVRLALKRMGRPEEIAAMAAFLACDDSSYCTGGEYPVDGGATATHALRL
ncbi:glucose 1-dehydrogenase [Saccharomonospora halophila]|uniref:glucose 1-dehydrogenase n=1 Tax=Saccharomonospora halophila TaxID=129922 RepID=UPI00036AF9B8|nr:glucose 1-dehydrogenase [Saccharomonospora halophila]